MFPNMKHNSSTLRTNVTATTTPTVYAAHVKIKMSPIVMETSGSLFLNMTCLTNMTQQDVSIAVTRHDKRYHGISLDFGEVALGRQAVLSHVTYCGYRNSVNTTNRCNASKGVCGGTQCFLGKAVNFNFMRNSFNLSW